MSDEVQADVAEVAHAVQGGPQLLDRARWDVCDAGLGADRRNDTGELHHLPLLCEDLPLLQPVSRLGLEPLRVDRPGRERLAARQVSLDGLAGGDLGHLLGRGERSDQQRNQEQQVSLASHAAHPPAGRSAGRSGGPPRRQNTSGSIVSR